jgi:hypothetical protein
VAVADGPLLQHGRSAASGCRPAGSRPPSGCSPPSASGPGEDSAQLVFLPLQFRRAGPQLRCPLQLRKLAFRGLVGAIAPGQLVHITDQLWQRRFLVNTRAAYSVFPNLSTSSPSGPALTGAAKQPISCWGDKFFHLSFGGQKFSWPFLQAAVQFPIIGADLLRHLGLLVDPAANQLVDCQTLHRFQSSTEAPYWPVSVSTLLPSACQLEEPFPSSPHWPLHLHGLSWGSLASPGSSPASTPSPFPVVSTVSHVKTSSRSCEAVSQAATCGPSSEAGRDWVAGLLRDLDVVNTAKRLPAVRHDVVHHIQTSGPPIASRFCRLEGAKLEAARQEFEAMERDGAIERSTSPWASPQHLLLKKDGMWRPCGDFRWLNLVTKPDIYPFPQHAGFLRPPEWLCVFFQD